MNSTISLCCITGNEAPAVEKFLESFKGAFDELCLVRAIGNQQHDKTLSLAKAWCEKNGKKFKADVYFNEGGPLAEGAIVNDNIAATWPHVDNFEAARNKCWSLATCDWQLWADLDDLLQPGSAEQIRAYAEAGTHDYYFFLYDLRSQNERNVRERMFRRGIATWTQPIHETLRTFPKPDGGEWRALIDEKVIFEHAPAVDKKRDPMRNRRIMAWHTRYFNAFAFELHREWYYEWQASKRPECAEQATKWAERAHLSDCLPQQRYDLYLNQANIAASKDIDHAMDLCWSAIRVNAKNRHAWGDLAEYELRAARGERAVLATTFMQSIPKAPESGYPQNNTYHGWNGAHLRSRALRSAGKPEAAQKQEDALFAANGQRISLLHATRGRPEKALETRNNFYRAAFIPLGVEHIFAIDADDEESLALLKDYRHVIVEKPNGCVKAWNAAAAASTGHILVQLSDDWLPCHDWDIAIWEELEKAAKARNGTIENAPLVLAISDNHRKDDLLCMAILTRARYEQQGYMFHPDYFGVYSDTEHTMRSIDDGVIVQAKHITFDHQHPFWTGLPIEQWDATHKRQNSVERYAAGKAIFNLRNPKHAIP